MTGSCEITVRDPSTAATNKGRLKIAARLKSGVGKEIEEKKKRTCSSCGEKGHY